MSVRAKFKCDSVARHAGDVGSVELSAVTTGSEENKSFFKWTPNANCAMRTLNAEALEEFEPGAEYYVDFTRVPKPE